MSKFRELKRSKVEVETILPPILKARRDALGIPNKELAADMGISPICMCAFFSGERSLTFRQLPQLCELLKIKVTIISRTEVRVEPY